MTTNRTFTHQLSVQYLKCQLDLSDLQYRHECLKSLWTASQNYKDDLQADKDIDEFIVENESHS